MADGSSTNEGIQQYYVTKIEEHQVGMIRAVDFLSWAPFMLVCVI